MDLSEFWSTIIGTVRPVKNIFGLYVLIYVLPLSIPVLIALEAHPRLFDELTNKVNTGAAIVIGSCCLFVVAWSIFFLIYFTKQRTKNPQLYRKGFVTDFSVRGK